MQQHKCTLIRVVSNIAYVHAYNVHPPAMAPHCRDLIMVSRVDKALAAATEDDGGDGTDKG